MTWRRNADDYFSAQHVYLVAYDDSARLASPRSSARVSGQARSICIPDASFCEWLHERLAEIRQLFAIIRRGSASIVEDQPVLAQLVVQGFARQAQCLGDAAQ